MDLSKLDADSKLKDLPTYGNAPGCCAGFCHFIGLLVSLLFSIVYFLVLLPINLLGRCVFRRAPIAPRALRVLKIMRMTLFDRGHSCSLGVRIRTAMVYLVDALRAHSIFSFFWYIDDFCGCGLCGGWKSVKIEEPIFMIANARSGSTEFGAKLHAVGDGEYFVAPNTLQTMFPFLWFWKFIRCFCCCIPKAKAEEEMQKAFAKDHPELWKRHRVNPLKPDTFELGWSAYSLAHVGSPAPCDIAAGPNAPGMNATTQSELKDFCRYTKAILKKHIHWYRRPAGKRVLIKGHFINAAPMLRQMFPDATFVNLVRDVGPMLQSQMNFFHVLPYWQLQFKRAQPGWAWLRPYVLRNLAAYTKMETDFYLGSPALVEGKPLKSVIIQFDDYVSNLEEALRQVLDCAGVKATEKEVKAAVSQEWATIKGPNEKYDINVTLQQLGISEAWMASTFKVWREKFIKPKDEEKGEKGIRKGSLGKSNQV